MKSFRLDTESITEAVESWPALCAAAALTALLVYLGRFDATSRIVLVVGGGVYFGYALREHLGRKLRLRYPRASWHVLLAIGLCVATAGVIARMALPAMQGSPLDLAWIVVSFVSILAFVVINRHDSDVLR
ncbi:MAG: hypothetical protein ACTHK7_08285 [Aureliella sp.]